MKRIIGLACFGFILVSSVFAQKVSFPTFFNQSFNGVVGTMGVTTLFTPTVDKDCFVSGYIESVSLDANGVTGWIGYTDNTATVNRTLVIQNNHNLPPSSYAPMFPIHAAANTPITVNVDVNGPNMSQSYNYHVTLLCQ